MELSIYEVIRGPVLSEKAQLMNQELGKLVLEVHMDANKPMIRQAMKKLFNVDTAKIRVQVRKGKMRRVARSRATMVDSDRKIALITLKKGQSLDLFGHGQTATASQEASAQETEK